jgi:ABC-type nickel/cobalt efflux system permease component RcnA
LTEASLMVLLQTAALIGLIHTLAGPDHYVPFIAMARVGGWSPARTVMITTLCGMAHVLSSVVLGALGIALGWAVGSLEAAEAWRGDVAGWLLLGFGIAYTIWGVRRAVRQRLHSHLHVHVDGTIHAHPHTHTNEHAHPHTGPLVPLLPQGQTAVPTDRMVNRMTPWVLFTVFIFGPCEPLIPILMYPAAQLDVGSVALVALVFGLATIGTMLTVVMLGYAGLTRLPLAGLERYSHAAAGGALTLCAAAMKLGL